ncbi:OmpA family protein [Stenotrophomonas maltophilia]|jgi:outer membrane protein OmpA-like peptidoglycan-associated protein|uniref:OmpA family protein n=1 Tax=Stenotrophomonas TaxID=40323 RepID=UPI00201CEE9E|nr:MULTISPECIES: OmpA family protein [Stenotrophomonas]MBN5025669.1 OmpA family protein [Stenotrophomonas maltophilia]MDH1274868.1 OmpA family protein [Stenotrophomonas sp. GD03937]MDH1486763.1 OmpA family protein [Stenotrophomonas sp. GD03712]UQY96393.1 OmpA family protein [Stenotrophomonas maltophilia]WON66969.1 OmpA family protein [Stenotrophomonas maltophilia]
MNQHRIACAGQLAAALGLVLGIGLLAACRSHAPVADGPAEATAVHFPEASKASLKEGIYPDVADLRRFAPGMSKRQLYTLLGTPHFNEGMWGVREWNYLFNFRTAQGAEYFTCQFQVRFDSKGIAQGGYWKPESCAAVLEPPRPPAPPPPPPAPLPEQPLRLSADALFGFDSAVLSSEGQQAVQGILAQVREASQVQSIRVTGYTDRIGSASYNQALSLRRAEAVRSALVQGGVPAASISAEGRGAADPMVQCAQRNRRELIACLAPNRRVQIAGVAQPR